MHQLTRWITTLAVACCLIASTAFAGPCRPTGQDITVRLNNGNYEKYFPMSSPLVQWASQQERDCMEAERLEAISQLAYLVADIAPNATDDAYDCITLAYSRIEVLHTYRGKTVLPKGAEWNHNTAAGRLYQCPGNVLWDFRTELMNSRNRARAAERLKNHPDLRDALDVNASFTAAGSFKFPAVPKYDLTARARAFMVDTRKKFPPCGGGNGCVDLHAAHAAHACRTKAKCEGRDPNTCEDPKVGHLLYELGCGDDEDCQWFRRIAPFDGRVDPRWDDTESCQVAKLEDFAHMKWTEAQAAGNAPESEFRNKQHDFAHEMENHAEGWEGVWPWDGVRPDRFLAEQGKELPPKVLLKLIAARYGL